MANKKPHPTLIMINPRIILCNANDVIPLAVTSRNSRHLTPMHLGVHS